MDFSATAIIAGVVSAIVILARVIEHLIIKKKNNGNGLLTQVQVTQLDAISKFCTQFEIRWDYMKSDIKALQDKQATLDTAVDKLVGSQERMIERMSDLITRIDKWMERQQ